MNSVLARLVGLALLFASVPLFASGTPAERPNILFILVDTLRKDTLRLYGYEQKTSFSVDALGRSGWVFENHIVHASQTVPSTLSLMLSRYPAEHGFRHSERGQFAKNRPVYPDGFRFLAETLQEAGFATAGFVANPFLGKQNHFDQGFDHFTYDPGRGERLTQAARLWLRNHAAESKKPFFVYMHYMDVHRPYDPPEEYAERFSPPGDGRLVSGKAARSGQAISERDLEYTRRQYAAGVAYIDDQVGSLLHTLDELGDRENTIIVFTSDHGEEFLEHGGMGHGSTVYGELVRVPLVIAYPRKFDAGRRIQHLSQHLDLGPTLLSLVGAPIPSEYRGRSILEPAKNVFAENGPWRAVYNRDRKLVFNRETDKEERYLTSDELDSNPLPAGTDTLSEQLAWYLALEDQTPSHEGNGEKAASWSAEELERLRALGYVD